MPSTRSDLGQEPVDEIVGAAGSIGLHRCGGHEELVRVDGERFQLGGAAAVDPTRHMVTGHLGMELDGEIPPEPERLHTDLVGREDVRT